MTDNPKRRKKRERRQCASVLWHGPGHQSTTRCRRPGGNHKLHCARYGSYDSYAEWTGRKACTGFFDEPPQEES